MKSFLLWALGSVLLLAIGLGIWFAFYITTPNENSGTATVLIPKGAGVRQIKTILGREGVIKDDLRFLLLARVTKSSNRLQAGEFAIERNLKPKEVLKILEQGEVIHHRLTIPEGSDMIRIAAIYANRGWVNQKEFLSLCTSPDFIHKLKIQQDSLEGYLFPDTYVLIRGESNTPSIIAAMVRRFLEVWQEVSSDTNNYPLTRHQTVTLASIIEKETAAPEERPLIARVFLNRLQRSMRLQSDPTVSYGLPDFNGKLSRKDLKRETPYNTYVIKALPPGPICSPGRAAIEAVFHPADSNALYFVSKNDGTHIFSKTLREHNRAVRKYQR
jgi:UPF0755 protein